MSDSRVFVAVPERLVGRLRENVELLIGVTAEALSWTSRAPGVRRSNAKGLRGLVVLWAAYPRVRVPSGARVAVPPGAS